MKSLILVRHGQTTAVSGTFNGRRDAPLSTLGQQQGQTNLVKLQAAGTELVISSGLQRTDYLGELAAAKGIKHIVDTDLQEVDFGSWDGLSWQEITAKHPELAQTWLKKPADMQFPDGEDMPSFGLRIFNAYLRILARPEKTIAISGHSGVLSQLFQLAHGSTEPRYLNLGELVIVEVNAHL
jgi:broad specificity phosphatase PhoE